MVGKTGKMEDNDYFCKACRMTGFTSEEALKSHIASAKDVLHFKLINAVDYQKINVFKKTWDKKGFKCRVCGKKLKVFNDFKTHLFDKHGIAIGDAKKESQQQKHKAKIIFATGYKKPKHNVDDEKYLHSNKNSSKVKYVEYVEREDVHCWLKD